MNNLFQNLWDHRPAILGGVSDHQRAMNAWNDRAAAETQRMMDQAPTVARWNQQMMDDYTASRDEMNQQQAQREAYGSSLRNDPANIPIRQRAGLTTWNEASMPMKPSALTPPQASIQQNGRSFGMGLAPQQPQSNMEAWSAAQQRKNQTGYYAHGGVVDHFRLPKHPQQVQPMPGPNGMWPRTQAEAQYVADGSNQYNQDLYQRQMDATINDGLNAAAGSGGLIRKGVSLAKELPWWKTGVARTVADVIPNFQPQNGADPRDMPYVQTPQYKATGGVVGMHPGEPRGTDTVPAWLTPGEAVLTPQATQAIGGKQTVDALNSIGKGGLYSAAQQRGLPPVRGK